MLKMKTKEAPSPPYVPTGMLKPNLDEVRNNYTPERLTDTMRAGCVSEYEFSLLRLVRAKDRRDRAVAALADFHLNAYPRDQKFKVTLARLQVEETEANAEYQYAQALRDVAEEAA